MKSYKHYSRIITIISGAASYLCAMNVNQLQSILPAQYTTYASLIIFIASLYTSIYSEDKRVERAENIVYDEITPETTNVDGVNNDI